MEVSFLRKPAEAGWYRLDGEQIEESEIGDTKAAVKIKLLRPAEIRKIQNDSGAAARKVFTGRRRIAKADDDASDKAMLHACVLDWRNFFEKDEGGSQKVLECSQENRELMDAGLMLFATVWRTVGMRSIAEEEEVSGN